MRIDQRVCHYILAALCLLAIAETKHHHKHHHKHNHSDEDGSGSDEYTSYSQVRRGWDNSIEHRPPLPPYPYHAPIGHGQYNNPANYPGNYYTPFYSPPLLYAPPLLPHLYGYMPLGPLSPYYQAPATYPAGGPQQPLGNAPIGHPRQPPAYSTFPPALPYASPQLQPQQQQQQQQPQQPQFNAQIPPQHFPPGSSGTQEPPNPTNGGVSTINHTLKVNKEYKEDGHHYRPDGGEFTSNYIA